MDNNNEKDNKSNGLTTVVITKNGILNGGFESKTNGHIGNQESIKSNGNGMNGDIWKSEASQTPPSVLPPVKVRLSWRQRGCYSIGHVFNDLCASMWFSYALIFYTHILGFSSSNAGTLFLIGQVADAISTPFVGLASDKQNNLKIFRYGRRKTWHAIGTICVIVSFPFLFIQCLGCEHSAYSMQMIYFASFIILFQFGWASVQVAHLSLIPDLTKTPNERTELSAYRNAFTAISSICVYGIAWIILGDSSGDTVGPSDLISFRHLTLIVSSIGIAFSIAFHIGVREPKLPPKFKPEQNKVCVDPSTESNGQAPTIKETEEQVHCDVYGKNDMTWKTWLKTLEFYKIGFLYMCTRLFCNLSQTYTPFYLQDSLHLRPDSIAYIPLVNYISGFLASMVMKKLNKKTGRKISYVVGGLVALGFCFWVFFGSGDSYTQYQIYAVAVLMGVGGNIMLVTCLGITADLIGDNVRSGAFVYGAMSFADKLSNGIVVVIVQNLNPVDSFYKNMLAFGCGIPAVIGLVLVFMVKTVDQRTPKNSLTGTETSQFNGQFKPIKDDEQRF